MLKPIAPKENSDSGILLTDKGSRIGVIYVPTYSNSELAEMHFIINGVDIGPCTKDIPYKERDLYVVIDVYGTTKQVRIIQYESSKFLAWKKL